MKTARGRIIYFRNTAGRANGTRRPGHPDPLRGGPPTVRLGARVPRRFLQRELDPLQLHLFRQRRRLEPGHRRARPVDLLNARLAHLSKDVHVSRRGRQGSGSALGRGRGGRTREEVGVPGVAAAGSVGVHRAPRRRVPVDLGQGGVHLGCGRAGLLHGRLALGDALLGLDERLLELRGEERIVQRAAIFLLDSFPGDGGPDGSGSARRPRGAATRARVPSRRAP